MRAIRRFYETIGRREGASVALSNYLSLASLTTIPGRGALLADPSALLLRAGETMSSHTQCLHHLVAVLLRSTTDYPLVAPMEPRWASERPLILRTPTSFKDASGLIAVPCDAPDGVRMPSK